MKDLVFENVSARALGECALVPMVISQSGITFFNTFSLENASNRGYRCSLCDQRCWWSGDEQRSLKLQGLNRSDVHVDFDWFESNGYRWYPWMEHAYPLHQWGGQFRGYAWKYVCWSPNWDSWRVPPNQSRRKHGMLLGMFLGWIGVWFYNTFRLD